MRKIFFCLVCLYLLSCNKDNNNPTPGRPLQLIWQKTFGGIRDDYGRALVNTSDGGFLLAGTSGSTDGDVTGHLGVYDFWIVKTDGAGSKQWSRSFGGSHDDQPNAAVATTDGGYVIVGNTFSRDKDVAALHEPYDIWVLKLDAAGDILWSKTVGGSWDIDNGNSVVATPDGGVALTGVMKGSDGDLSTDLGFGDLAVVKLDASGNRQWSKGFGGSEVDAGTCITVTNDGGYAITGYTNSSDGDAAGSHGITDILVVKLNSSGIKQWGKVFGGSKRDVARSIIATPDGGYLIGGYSESNDGDVTIVSGESDAILIKTDADGNKQWVRTYGGGGTEEITSLLLQGGGYITLGNSRSNDGDFGSSHGEGDVWIMGADASGTPNWNKLFGGESSDYPAAIIRTNDKGFAVVGYTNSQSGDVSGNRGFTDMWLLKLEE